MAQATKPLPVDVAQPDDTPFAITDLAPTARALVALKSTETELHLKTIAAKHVGLVEIKDKAGREQVHGAAMELMRARTAIKKTADEVRDDAKKFNAAVIAEEKRLTALVEAEETRLKALRDAWDAEQERIKREAEEKERARILAAGKRVQEIREFAKLAHECRSSEAVRRIAGRLAEVDMTGFEEFEDEAVKIHAETTQQVEQVLNTRLATEAEAARLKAEREELERQQAEAKRQADELAAQQKAEADKLAEERAELQRMRAEIEAAKAPKVDRDATGELYSEKRYPTGEPMYSTTTFRDDGVPIMLTPEGKRSIFCDLDEGDLTYGPEHLAPQPAPGLAFDARGVLVPIESATCCENGPPGGVCEECAEISAGYQAAMAPATSDAQWTEQEIQQIKEAGPTPPLALNMLALPVIQPAMLDADLVDTATPAAASTWANPPSAERLIHAIASVWSTDAETACQWLVARADDFEAWVPSVADIA
jgi:hypothetical protein